MRAERFTGASLLEAVQHAKQALGPDALILEARGPAGGWLRHLRPAGFEVRAVRASSPGSRPPASDPAVAELHRLGARIESLAASLEDSGRLAEEVIALRGAIEALEGRLVTDPSAASSVRTRLARVRIGPEGADRSPDPTPRSVDAWTRN